MQNALYKLLIGSIPEPSLRAELNIHSVDYEAPEAASAPRVKSSPDTTKVAFIPDKPVSSANASSCLPATNAPSFQPQSSSSKTGQQAAGGKEKTASTQVARAETIDRTGSHTLAISSSAAAARKTIVVRGYLEAIQSRDVKAVKTCIADEIRYYVLDDATMKTALWLAITGKDAAVLDLIVPFTSHSAKLEIMVHMLSLKPAYRAAFKPCVDAIMDSYNRPMPGSLRRSNAEKVEAESVRKMLNLG